VHPATVSPAVRDQIIAYAVEHPTEGPRSIAWQLRKPRFGAWRVSHSVYNVLKGCRAQPAGWVLGAGMRGPCSSASCSATRPACPATTSRGPGTEGWGWPRCLPRRAAAPRTNLRAQRDSRDRQRDPLRARRLIVPPGRHAADTRHPRERHDARPGSTPARPTAGSHPGSAPTATTRSLWCHPRPSPEVKVSVPALIERAAAAGSRRPQASTATCRPATRPHRPAQGGRH
jgi:hypothetical protein